MISLFIFVWPSAVRLIENSAPSTISSNSLPAEGPRKLRETFHGRGTYVHSILTGTSHSYAVLPTLPVAALSISVVRRLSRSLGPFSILCLSLKP